MNKSSTRYGNQNKLENYHSEIIALNADNFLTPLTEQQNQSSGITPR